LKNFFSQRSHKPLNPLAINARNVVLLLTFVDLPILAT
jgi:hypothetical protein